MALNKDENALTLDALLSTLHGNLVKQAEEAEGKEKEESGKSEDNKEQTSEKTEDENKKKDDESGESDEDEKDDDKGQVKSAAEAGASLFKEIMEKVASSQLGTEMNKQTKQAGSALASALLKKASAGDLNTMDGLTPGAVPNKAQVDNAQMVAEDDKKIKPMPTGDGQDNYGTINEIFDAIIQDALAQGAASHDQVHTTGVSNVEGAASSATPNQVPVEGGDANLQKAAAIEELVNNGVNFEDAVQLIKEAELELADDLEKQAAVSALVDEGFDFDQAVELVKFAEEQINQEIEKTAALNSLLSEGVDFDSAVQMIKEASAGDITTMEGIAPGSVPNKAQADNAQIKREDDAKVMPMPTGDGQDNHGSVNQIFDGLIERALSQGAASQDQVHETGVSAAEGSVEDHAVPNQVKVAAVNRLVNAGVNFEEAVAYVGQSAEMAKQASIGDMARRAGQALSSAGSKVREVGRKVVSHPSVVEAKDLATSVVTGKSKYSKETGNAVRKAALSNLAKNPVALGVAGAGAAGVAAGAGLALSRRNREKQAALNALVSGGVDFEQAASLVSEKSKELYGE